MPAIRRDVVFEQQPQPDPPPVPQVVGDEGQVAADEPVDHEVLVELNTRLPSTDLATARPMQVDFAYFPGFLPGARAAIIGFTNRMS